MRVKYQYSKLMYVKYQYSKHAQSPRELANYEGFRPSKWRQVQSSAFPPRAQLAPPSSQKHPPTQQSRPLLLKTSPVNSTHFPRRVQPRAMGERWMFWTTGRGEYYPPLGKAGIMQCTLCLEHTGTLYYRVLQNKCHLAI